MRVVGKKKKNGGLVYVQRRDNTRLHKIDACSYLYMIGTYANIKDINGSK